MGWPKGKSRKPFLQEEEMKKTSPVLAKRARTGELSSDGMILNTKLATYMETFIDGQDGQAMHSEITSHLEQRIGNEKNGETVSELHGYLETVLDSRNSEVFRLNDELDTLAENTTIFQEQEMMLLKMDRMDLKQLEQFDGFLQLCLKKSQFMHVASTSIHPEYEHEELIYTALCDFAENSTKDKYKASNNYRVRIAPRQNSGLGVGRNNASESQKTTE